MARIVRAGEYVDTRLVIRREQWHQAKLLAVARDIGMSELLQCAVAVYLRLPASQAALKDVARQMVSTSLEIEYLPPETPRGRRPSARDTPDTVPPPVPPARRGPKKATSGAYPCGEPFERDTADAKHAAPPRAAKRPLKPQYRPTCAGCRTLVTSIEDVAPDDAVAIRAGARPRFVLHKRCA